MIFWGLIQQMPFLTPILELKFLLIRILICNFKYFSLFAIYNFLLIEYTQDNPLHIMYV